jgi:homoprotocatechuate degradation regulator HpaR
MFITAKGLGRRMAEGDRMRGSREAPLTPLRQSLPACLMRAREAVMARVRPTLREHDMTEPQWRVLRTLASLEEVEITQLSEMVFLLPSSLSRILRDLGERGLVRRRTSHEDLRRGLVSVSDKGREMIHAAMPATAATNAEIERLFGTERLRLLLTLLHELEEALGMGQPED